MSQVNNRQFRRWHTPEINQRSLTDISGGLLSSDDELPDLITRPIIVELTPDSGLQPAIYENFIEDLSQS